MQTPTCANPVALFSAQGVVGLVFLVTLGIIIVGGLIATTARRPVRAIAGLALCFTGVAGTYYFLLAPFVAMMQMLIYVGAVSILIAFAIMMATPEQQAAIEDKDPPFAGPLGLGTALFFFGGLALLGIHTPWPATHPAGRVALQHTGVLLLTSHSLVFELVSLVLLIAIIGALVLARRGRNS